MGVLTPALHAGSSGCSPMAMMAWMPAEVASASVASPRATGKPPSLC